MAQLDHQEVKYMDLKPHRYGCIHCYQAKRWLRRVPHGGIVAGWAYLIIVNRRRPCQSVILKEVVT